MNFGGIEEIYKVLFNTIGEGLIIVDKQGKIILANPRSYDLFGYQEGDLVGLPVDNLLPDSFRSDHAAHRENYQKHPKKRRMGQNMNLKAQRQNGDQFDVEISLNHFQQDQDMFVVAMITDISERVAQNKQIQELNANLELKVEQRTREVFESQKLYSAIAKNFPNGTINVFDSELKYLFVEGLELAALGLTADKLIGSSYLDKISKDIRPEIEKQLSLVFHGKSIDFELNFKDQTYRINAVPLSNDEKGIDKILVIEENITQHKIIEQQREAALTKERYLNEMKSRFVSMASHEFRTPLSTVLSSVSLIEKYIEKGDYEKTEKHTKRVKNAVAGLTEILNDFLSVEKLESNNNEPILAEFDFRELIEEMVEEVEVILKEGQKLNLILTEQNYLIKSDFKILKNVLYNLISNAIKYSSENSEIKLKAEIENANLHLSVQDFGIGIPEQDQNELFGRFYRASNATNIKGTGLGLNIVKKYIDSLNGEISFKSELNVGTTFEISIPISS